jgi:hypothetical protein
MIDMVPKAISLTLVNQSKENLQRELLQELYKQDVLDELLKESEFVVNRRKEVVTMVDALNKAEECVHFHKCFMVKVAANKLSFWQDCSGCLISLGLGAYITKWVPCMTSFPSTLIHVLLNAMEIIIIHTRFASPEWV